MNIQADAELEKAMLREGIMHKRRSSAADWIPAHVDAEMCVNRSIWVKNSPEFSTCIGVSA
jgi:hypothetical protein